MNAVTVPVVILAGGLGQRLRPLTDSIPKALIPVRGEPFLAHQLRLLRNRGVERVVICVGYRGKMIEEFAGDGGGFGLRIEYSTDWPDLLGTAGAIRKASPLLEERFFVVYGDSYLPCDYRAVERAFLTSGRPALMTVYRNEGRWDASNVEFAGGRIVAYDKKAQSPRMQHIDYGLAAFERGVFESPGPADLAGLFGELLRAGELAAFEVPDRFYEIGSTAGIRDLEQYLGQTGKPA